VALCVAFASAISLGDSPLRAVQMLWVNMVMDTLASVALSSEKPNMEVLDRLPKGSGESIVSKDMFSSIVGMAIYMLIILFLVQYYGPTWLNLRLACHLVKISIYFVYNLPKCMDIHHATLNSTMY
jgi:magnesium-transporting ATPase (P-type)